jgi:inosine-uridine nucleoside N-ribohydrolase
MVGLDVTYEPTASMDQVYLDRLADKAGEAGAFLERINRYYMKFYEQSRGVSATFQHDSIAVAYVIAPQIFTVKRGRLKVLTDGAARGQTLFSPEGHHTFEDAEWSGLPTHKVCSKLDGSAFLELYEKAIVNAQS